MIEDHLHILKELALNATPSGRNIYCYWCYKNLFHRFRNIFSDMFGHRNNRLLLNLDEYFKICIFIDQSQQPPKTYLDFLTTVTSNFDPDGEEEEYVLNGCIELLESAIILLNQISLDSVDNVENSALKMLNVIDLGNQLVPDRIGDSHIDLVVQKQRDAVVFMAGTPTEDEISVFEFP